MAGGELTKDGQKRGGSQAEIPLHGKCGRRGAMQGRVDSGTRPTRGKLTVACGMERAD